MRSLLIFDVALAIVALALFCVDIWADWNDLLGTRMSEEKVVGRRVDDLFDRQPVIPDQIEIYPLQRILVLQYEQVSSLWHKYPSVGIFAENDVIMFCKRGE